MTKAQLLKDYAEVYELEHGGWLVKTRAGRFVVLTADGRQGAA